MSKRTTRNESSDNARAAQAQDGHAGRTRCHGAESPSPSQEDC